MVPISALRPDNRFATPIIGEAADGLGETAGLFQFFRLSISGKIFFISKKRLNPHFSVLNSFYVNSPLQELTFRYLLYPIIGGVKSED